MALFGGVASRVFIFNYTAELCATLFRLAVCLAMLPFLMELICHHDAKILNCKGFNFISKSRCVAAALPQSVSLEIAIRAEWGKKLRNFHKQQSHSKAID